MEKTTDSELMNHDCLLVRRGIGWIGLLGGIKKSYNKNLQKTNLKGVI